MPQADLPMADEAESSRRAELEALSSEELALRTGSMTGGCDDDDDDEDDANTSRCFGRTTQYDKLSTMTAAKENNLKAKLWLLVLLMTALTMPYPLTLALIHWLECASEPPPSPPLVPLPSPPSPPLVPLPSPPPPPSLLPPPQSSPLSLQSSAAGWSPNRDWALHRLDHARAPLAACLDGSSPVYYFRRGLGPDASKLLIFVQGGGWCTSTDECSRTRHDPLGKGSTAHDADIRHSRSFEGILSSDPRVSEFASWSAAYFRSCDGGSFAGSRQEPDWHEGAVFYRGHHNFDGLLNDLLDGVHGGIAQWSEVLLSGCSAGAMAVAIHCDKTAQRFAHVNAPTACLVDAGVFPTQDFSWLLDHINLVEALPPRCISFMGSDWRECVHASTALRFVETRTLLLNDQMNWLLGWRAVGMTAWYRGYMANLLDLALMTNPLLSLFSPACEYHCLTTNSQHWQLAAVAGVNVKSMTERWYFDASTHNLLRNVSHPRDSDQKGCVAEAQLTSKLQPLRPSEGHRHDPN